MLDHSISLSKILENSDIMNSWNEWLNWRPMYFFFVRRSDEAIVGYKVLELRQLLFRN